jgi:pyrroline-5-carboxylate reductase
MDGKATPGQNPCRGPVAFCMVAFWVVVCCIGLLTSGSLYRPCPAMTTPAPDAQAIAFIGGGNMASALIGGLRRQGVDGDLIEVVEPLDEQRQRLQTQWGVRTCSQAHPGLGRAGLVVWAIKPQIFADAASQTAPHTAQALHLSVAAGISTDSMASWLRSQRIVRAMPNTPALIGRGITGLYARPAVSAEERRRIELIIGPSGELIWLDQEDRLNAVTALSGSGPAYVFYFLEAMIEAGIGMGLDAQQARQLALATFGGAAALAQSSEESPQQLRARVTSKGGTTFAALSAMEAAGLKPHFIAAMVAAQERARELGEEFGRSV